MSAPDKTDNPGKTKFSASQTKTIEQAVFVAVEKTLSPAYYLLSTEMEKEFGQWFLRVYIARADKARMTLGDCVTVSREIDPVIEVLPELRDAAYSLEVSSPGAFRPLGGQREMDFFLGEPIRVVKHAPHDPKARQPKVLSETTGELAGFDAQANTLHYIPEDAVDPVSMVLEADHTVYLNPPVPAAEPDEAGEPGELEPGKADTLNET